MFVWGALHLFPHLAPARQRHEHLRRRQAVDVEVQHPGGQHEINSLHVPMGAPSSSRMISQDVFHSFFVPAFRVKREVHPGPLHASGSRRPSPAPITSSAPSTAAPSTRAWSATGRGPDAGRLQAMAGQRQAEGSLAQKWRKGFSSIGCTACHRPRSGARGPNLARRVRLRSRLADNRVVLADDDYIRDSILEPNARSSPASSPIMPTFQGQISEDGRDRSRRIYQATGAAAIQPAEQPHPRRPDTRQRGAEQSTRKSNARRTKARREEDVKQ